MVYLDDIVIYSSSLEEHSVHLRKVFTRLREHTNSMSSKCSFAQTKIQFLGHVIEHGRIRMDPAKVQAIQEWQPPTNVSELRSFLGLANYSRKFVRDYSKIALPLTELLKKSQTWDWAGKCQSAFDAMKKAMSEDPVLALPDVTRSKYAPMPLTLH